MIKFPILSLKLINRYEINNNFVVPKKKLYNNFVNYLEVKGYCRVFLNRVYGMG